jgi:5-carboxyvanillate decarboxylase
VEEAFVTPGIMTQWHVVLAGHDVEPGFAKMGESISPARTPSN